MEQSYRIAVAGIGYVGLANAILLAQHNAVTAVDVLPQRVQALNERRSPIADKEAQEYLSGHELDLRATTNGDEAYRDAGIPFALALIARLEGQDKADQVQKAIVYKG